MRGHPAPLLWVLGVAQELFALCHPYPKRCWPLGLCLFNLYLKLG